MRILHWSDSHQSSASEQSANAIVQSAPTGTIPIYTGDASFQAIGQGQNADIINNNLLVIGNHDRMSNTNSNAPVDAANSLVSSTYFGSGYTRAHATMANVSNPTYWHMVQDGVMFIGLDCTLTASADINAERNWLIDRLNECRANGYKAIPISHIIALGKTVTDCCFSEYGFWTGTDWYSNYDYTYVHWGTCVDSLNSVMQGNSDVIAFCLYGHSHSDGIFLSSGYPEIVIGDSYLGDIGEYNYVARSTTAYTNDNLVMNMYDYDVDAGTVVIYRLGASTCRNGAKRLMCGIDLNSNEIVTQFSNR